MNKKYSIKKGFLKALVAVVVFAIPMLINMFPEWANLTIGGVLMMMVNFVKVKFI